MIAAATRERLADLDYDFDRLGALMAARRWTTVQLVWREHDTRFHARDPFPPGGTLEDPATGAAAAAFGGYLRELGLVTLPATITIVQGEDMGRPSLLTVDITDRPEIDVTGHGRRHLTAARTSATNASTSSGVVSHAAIQRTSPVFSSQT